MVHNIFDNGAFQINHPKKKTLNYSSQVIDPTDPITHIIYRSTVF